MSGNRAVSVAYRNSVLVALHDAGLYSARQLKDRPVGPAFPGSTNVIDGLDWVLMTRVDRGPVSFSEKIRDAQRFTDMLGVSRSAVIVPRAGYSVSESFVISELGDFVTVLSASQTKRRTA